jgi:hypothetical protein
MIDGVTAIGMTREDVPKKLRGAKGTKVDVTIFRAGMSKLLDFPIIRDKIPLYSVDAAIMVNDDVGYVRVTRFAATTYDELSKALASLQEQGMKKLSLDYTTMTEYDHHFKNVHVMFDNDDLKMTLGEVPINWGYAEVMAYATLQLVDAGKIALDTPIADYLEQPLPSYSPDPVFPDKYGPYKDLAGDERWRKITPRMVLTHSTGFANFAFLEPDRKLRIHYDPGTRYAYSGEGFILLQFAIEHGRMDKGLGLDVGDLTQKNIFAPLGMTRTSLVWRDSFAGNLADGWNDKGDIEEHDARSKVRAAGSMDTTIALPLKPRPRKCRTMSCATVSSRSSRVRM